MINETFSFLSPQQHHLIPSEKLKFPTPWIIPSCCIMVYLCHLYKNGVECNSSRPFVRGILLLFLTQASQWLSSTDIFSSSSFSLIIIALCMKYNLSTFVEYHFHFIPLIFVFMLRKNIFSFYIYFFSASIFRGMMLSLLTMTIACLVFPSVFLFQLVTRKERCNQHMEKARLFFSFFIFYFCHLEENVCNFVNFLLTRQIIKFAAKIFFMAKK